MCRVLSTHRFGVAVCSGGLSGYGNPYAQPRTLLVYLSPCEQEEHCVLGLPRLLFPLISPSMTSFSIPRSSLTTCPTYLKAACATLDSSVHSGSMFSSTHTLVFLSHDTHHSLQHHISNASIFFLSAFLIVQVSAPYSSFGNTKAFTSFTFVASFIPLFSIYSIFIAALHIPIILGIFLSHNPSLVINARNIKG